jgi:hypothetical protein
MANYEVLYWLRDVAACLGALVGIGGAVFLFIRKKPLPAVLALIGFVMFSVDPLLDIILWRLIANSAANPNWNTMSATYSCLSGGGALLGSVLIVLAFILAFREPKLPPPPISSDLPPAV